jgi:hypothetical protein
MPFIERRHATRYDLHLPVVVRWMDGSELREACTVSEDVSSKGIYFVLAEGIKDGTTVEVEIEMTLPNRVASGELVFVRCLGHVERSAPEEGAKAGVAAAIENYQFLTIGAAPNRLLHYAV